MSLRRIGRISASQSRWNGSAVAITHLVGPHLHRQDAEPRRVGIAHDPGYRRQVDLQRIDVQIVELAPVRHPLRQEFEVEHAVRGLQRFPVQPGNDHQRMGIALEVAALLLELDRLAGFDHAIGNEGIDHFRQRQAVILDGGLAHGKVRLRGGYEKSALAIRRTIADNPASPQCGSIMPRAFSGARQA
jgi:hypothetical protein